jgi:hypothetical protein
MQLLGVSGTSQSTQATIMVPAKRVVDGQGRQQQIEQKNKAKDSNLTAHQLESLDIHRNRWDRRA